MKLHRSLGYARVAVRQCANAGEGFRETHGLHGNMDKLYYAAVKWGHHALLTGIQKVSEKIRAYVRFPANLCPACISGERHAVHRGALPCDACQMPHSATVGGGITALQATLKCATGGQPGQPRNANWDLRPGCERETHRNVWGMPIMAPRRIYLAANQSINHQPAPVPREMS